ncbi:hypothetical protein Tco_0340913 [Tanacetum coccineum]
MIFGIEERHHGPSMQCTTLPSHSRFLSKEFLVSIVTEITKGITLLTSPPTEIVDIEKGRLLELKLVVDLTSLRSHFTQNYTYRNSWGATRFTIKFDGPQMQSCPLLSYGDGLYAFNLWMKQFSLMWLDSSFASSNPLILIFYFFIYVYFYFYFYFFYEATSQFLNSHYNTNVIWGKAVSRNSTKRNVADSLHVPLNGYSPKQKQFSFMWLASSSASSNPLILIFYFFIYLIQKLRQKEVDEESCMKTCSMNWGEANSFYTSYIVSFASNGKIQAEALIFVVVGYIGRQNRGQGNNARGAGIAGYGGAQNRVRNANPGGQDNVVDEDVDKQPVQDLALNVDNVFQADDCDALDFDVNEAPTAQTMFMANLSSADPVCDESNPSYDSDILFEVHDHDHYQDVICEHYEVHEMHDDVQPNYIVDSHADYTSDSNKISYDQYVKDNAVPVVQSNVSFVPNDAYMMILNDMHEQPAQYASVTTQNNVVDKSLTAELATYKEQVELYER